MIEVVPPPAQLRRGPDRRGGGRVVGRLDAPGRCACSAMRSCSIPSTRRWHGAGPKPHARAQRHPGRSGAAPAAAQAHAQLELRDLEREVRANLVYRQFTRVGAQKVPDAKTLGKLGLALGPEIIEQLHQRVVAIAQEKRIVQGRRLRVDTTVVETNIHYPDRQHAAGRRGTGAHPHDEAHRAAGRGRRGEVARPHAQRALSADRDRPGQPQPQRAGQGEAQAELPEAAARHRTGGRASADALPARWPRGSSGPLRSGAGALGGQPRVSGDDDPARAASHAADARAHRSRAIPTSPARS